MREKRMTSAEARERLQCSRAEKKKEEKKAKLYSQKGKGKAMCVSVAIAIFPWTHQLGFFQQGSSTYWQNERRSDGAERQKEREGEGADVEM